jgi:hypothetical protein
MVARMTTLNSLAITQQTVLVVSLPSAVCVQSTRVSVHNVHY